MKDPESVADHMYRMGLMALIASDIPGLNRDKLSFVIHVSPSISIHLRLLVCSKLRFYTISGV